MPKPTRLWACALTPALCALITAPAHAQITALTAPLAAHGITLSLSDNENLLANLAGGIKQGATMQGVTTGTLEVDTAKAFNLPGGTFHITALQIHGQNLSPAYLGNLQTANGNEAQDTTRLWELWYDQSFANADIKIGQQSIDNEFITSKYSALFLNTPAGWPLLPSDDLYGGGPAYPLASLGARLQVKATSNLTILTGVFNDNPGGGAFADNAQTLDANGAKFNLNTGALLIAELQYTPPTTLPGTYKLGLWYDTASFPDQLYGTARMHHGNASPYAVVDQTIWQSSSRSAQTLNIFGRIMAAPANENLIDLAFNGGITLTAPLPGRDADQAGINLGLGHVSHRIANRGTETLVELTYQAQLTPWLALQPDIQYILNPGANAPQTLHNEFVTGLRAITNF